MNMHSLLYRLRKIVESASIITCSRLCEPPQVKPWIHPEGRVLVVGDAAHPFPVSLASLLFSSLLTLRSEPPPTDQQ